MPIILTFSTATKALQFSQKAHLSLMTRYTIPFFNHSSRHHVPISTPRIEEINRGWIYVKQALSASGLMTGECKLVVLTQLGSYFVLFE